MQVVDPLLDVASELDRWALALRAQADDQDRGSAAHRGFVDPQLVAVLPAETPSGERFGGSVLLDLTGSNDPEGDDGIDNGNGGQKSDSTPTDPNSPTALTQEEVDRILIEYQVEEDVMEPWEVSDFEKWLADLAGVDVPGPKDLTVTEGEMLSALGLIEKQDFMNNADLAWSEVYSRFGDVNGEDPHQPNPRHPYNDDHADAFRHAYVSALTSRDFGDDWSTDYWTAHERVPDNEGVREAMDLYNNEVGRRIAADNPGASDGELADLVERAVADGEMVVIDSEGNLVPSNSIQPSEAGHPAPGAEEMPGHPQDKQTS